MAKFGHKNFSFCNSTNDKLKVESHLDRVMTQVRDEAA